MIETPFPEAAVRAQVRLELRQVGATIADSAEVDVSAEYLSKRLVYRLTAYVLTEHLCETEQTLYFDWPATWWQHLKVDLGWAWLLRRWPARLKRDVQTARFERVALYPEANVAMPSLGRAVIIESFTKGRFDQ